MSSFFTVNTLESRRSLRSQIERRSLDINRDFLNAFKSVKTSLDDICEEVNSMKQSVERMRECLHVTQTQTHDLIAQTNELQNERSKLCVREDVASAIIKHFQLSPSDHQTLHGNPLDRDKITLEFFQVLDKIQTIHADCRTLMQSGFETLALDVMEEMTLHQEFALERLYRWAQSHCRNIDTSHELTNIVIEAMQRLQDRPVLFKYIIDEYAQNRRAVIVKQFIEALTVGEGVTKPIEMHIHEPKRYVGDIFAWVHHSIHAERESLMMLVRSCDKFDITETINSALQNIADGICHTLRVRIEAVLNSVNDTIALYSIANVIRFYWSIITSIVKGGQLEQLLMDIQQVSEQFYMNSLTQRVRDILNEPHDLQRADLAPPASVRRLLSMLKELLSVANMVEGRQQDIVKIVSSIVDPLLQSITEQASHLPAIDMSVYFLNVLHEISGTLAVYEFMDERMERLNGQCDAQIETLTSEQASSIVAHLNLGPIYTVLQSHDVALLDVHHLKLCMVRTFSLIVMSHNLKQFNFAE